MPPLLPGGDLDAVLAVYDALPAVTVEEMLGTWRGTELPTGHPMDGLLERFGWYGKRFDSPDDVHPLLFGCGDGGGGRPVSLDPARMPLGEVLRHPRAVRRLARLPGATAAFALVRPLLVTTRPTARLRMVEYRGVVTATMCYDARPVHDSFRRFDERTVLGAMELRGSPQPFLFALTRAPER